MTNSVNGTLNAPFTLELHFPIHGRCPMAIDSTGGRPSPENIKDVLLRAELYREIRAAQTKDLEKNWFTYEIQPSETLMPELIAYRAYSMDTLKWVIMIAAALDDPRERVEAGTVLTLPTTAWLRGRDSDGQHGFVGVDMVTGLPLWTDGLT